MGRLRQRLDQMQGEANATMGQAQATLGNAQELIAFAREVLAEVQDGVTLELVKEGDASIMDFLTGKAAVLPIKVRIKLEE